jgi:subtilase family serine protease
VAAGHLDVTGSPDPQADLLVGSLQASPSSVLSGGVLTIQSNIRNEGDLSASQFHVRFYLSQDSVIESTDFLVGVRTIFQLGIDSGSAQSFPYTLDASLPLGDYYFGAICDDPNVILESDEDNNVEVLPGLIEIFVPPPPAPDLTLVDLSFDPASVSLGGQFQVSHTVRNVGNLDAESYRVDYYISLDSEITSDDFLAGSGLTAPSLAIGDEAPSSSQIDLPAEVTVGTWYVGGIVSILTGTADSNLSNDDLSASTTLEVTL